MINWKPPKDYKPAKPSTTAAIELNYLTESLSRLHNSMTSFLHKPSTAKKLTSAEETHFTSVCLLCGILTAALTTPRSSGTLPASVPLLFSSLKSALATLRASFLDLASTSSNTNLADGGVYSSLTDMQTLSQLRETVLAIRHSSGFLVAHHERELARDKSGKSGVHKDILAEMKAVDATAGKVVAEIRGRVKELKERLGEGGWLDRVLEWTFGADGEDDIASAVSTIIGGRAVAEDWAGRVLESWREGVKGWGMVKME